MSTEYSPIYSSFGRILNRVKQVNETMLPQFLAYQQYIDRQVDNTLRSALGTYDANGFLIALPLSGSYDIIDVKNMIIQLNLDFEVCMAADDCVIAKFRQDTAENEKKVEIAEATLRRVIQTKYGGPISIDQDFSTDYLASIKVLSFNNGAIASFSGAGVLLAFNSPPPNQAIPGSNPDSRVIFVPAPPFGI